MHIPPCQKQTGSNDVLELAMEHENAEQLNQVNEFGVRVHCSEAVYYSYA